MSDAATVLLQLHRLAPGGAGASPESTGSALFALCEALGNAGALLGREGQFPALCMKELSELLAALGGGDQEMEGGEAAAEEVEVRTSLRSGMLHCLYWLYGLQLPGIEEEAWGGAFQASAPPRLLRQRICAPIRTWMRRALN